MVKYDEIAFSDVNALAFKLDVTWILAQVEHDIMLSSNVLHKYVMWKIGLKENKILL